MRGGPSRQAGDAGNSSHMKTTHRSFHPLAVALSAALVVLALPAAAQSAAEVKAEAPAERTHLSLELDPTPFFSQGWSAVVKVRPAPVHRLELSLAAYAVTLPSFATESGENQGKGFVLENRPAFVLGTDYHVFEGETWGVTGGVLWMLVFDRVTSSQAPGAHAEFTSLAAVPRIGVQWRPFRDGPYLYPWVGAGFYAKVAGTTDVGTLHYAPAAIQPGFGLHLGWRFAL